MGATYRMFLPTLVLAGQRAAKTCQKGFALGIGRLFTTISTRSSNE